MLCGYVFGVDELEQTCKLKPEGVVCAVNNVAGVFIGLLSTVLC